MNDPKEHFAQTVAAVKKTYEEAGWTVKSSSSDHGVPGQRVFDIKQAGSQVGSFKIFKSLPEKSWWRRLVDRILRRDQWVTFSFPKPKDSVGLYVAGSEDDPVVKLRRWIETQPAITDWKIVDGTPVNLYMQATIHDRPFKLSLGLGNRDTPVPGGDFARALRVALENAIALGPEK